MRTSVMLLTLLVASAACAQNAPPLEPGQKWYHVMTNLLRDEEVDRQIALMKRAAAAGYNGVTVNDVKLIKYHLYGREYVDNVRRFREACRAEGVKFVPCVTPIGYAENILAHDPNLAAGMPVRDATFVVTDGRLVPDASDAPALVNASFEEFEGDQPAGWSADEPGKITFADRDVKTHGNVSIRQQDVKVGDEFARGRVYQKIKVKPYHYYHVSVMVKTEDCKNKDRRIMALGDIVLNWQPPAIENTMDWKRVHATFNSLYHDEITLYIGTWDGKTGKIWYDDVQVEPGGFVNIIRRDSLPLKVASLDGRTTYVEGKDFSPVVDPRLVKDPNPGYFTLWHEAPAVTIPADSRLKNGQKVLVSYHHATNAGKDFQINACISEPKLYDLIEQEIAWIKKTADPDAYFMSHDEIRHQGWDDSCTKRNMTTGQMLADNVQKCSRIIEKVDPGKSIIVWNDMFDPHHNARKTGENGERFTMYLAKGDGPWFESWLGLEKQVAVMNWNGGSEPSAKFFSDRGHQQILSHTNPEAIVKWLKASGKNPGVVGVMYTTWTGDFSGNFEKYIEAVKEWEKTSGGFGAR